MKALIISDDKEVSSFFDDYFVNKGFSTIIYRWLLKALDNIEEIKPDCILISAAEYPRHWKTLVQFVKSGICGNKIAIFLYEPTSISESDEEKARLLGVTGSVTNMDQTSLSELSAKIDEFFQEPKAEKSKDAAIFDKEIYDDIISVDMLLNNGTLQAEDDKMNMKGSGYFIFTEPETQASLTGQYFDFNQKTMLCKFDSLGKVSNLTNQYIPDFVYGDFKEQFKGKAKITEAISVNDDMVLVVEIE